MNLNKLKVRIALNCLLGIVSLIAGILFVSSNTMTGILLIVVAALWFTSAFLNFIQFKNNK